MHDNWSIPTYIVFAVIAILFQTSTAYPQSTQDARPDGAHVIVFQSHAASQQMYQAICRFVATQNVGVLSIREYDVVKTRETAPKQTAGNEIPLPRITFVIYPDSVIARGSYWDADANAQKQVRKGESGGRFNMMARFVRQYRESVQAVTAHK